MPQSEHKQYKAFFHLRENENIVILADIDFSPDELLTAKSAANAFINKLDDATNVKAKAFNIFQNFIHAAQLKLLEGSDISRAKINEKHRVLLITRYNADLKKQVVLLVRDDPEHKYNLKSIQDSYSSKGYSCGSNQHWGIIINAIQNKNMHYLTIPQSAYVKPVVLPKPAVATPEIPKKSKEKAPSRKPQNLVNPDKNPSPSIAPSETTQPKTENKQETSTTSFNPVVTEENSPQLTSPQMENVPLQSESKEEAPAKKKKKKKKKKKTSNEEIKSIYKSICEKTHTENEFHKYLYTLMTKKNNLQIITALLDLGMNPDLENCDGFCLLRSAIQEQQVEVVKLLLQRGASLSSRWNYNGEEVRTHLTTAIDQNDHIEIIKALVKETAKRGLLNETIPDRNGAGRRILHFAVQTQHLAAVQALVEAGADLTVKDGDGYTPYEYAINFQNMSKTIRRLPLAERESTLTRFGLYKHGPDKTWEDIKRIVNPKKIQPSSSQQPMPSHKASLGLK